MTTLPPEALDRVRTFLTSRGWTVAREGERFDDYRPPTELAVPHDFLVTVPRVPDAPDLSRYLTRLAEMLANVYLLTAEQLEPLFAHASTVLSMSIDRDLRGTNSVSFAKFETLMDRLRRMLLHTAAFVAEEDPLIDLIPPEAHTYLENCRFLHTTRGSFVANVELPAGDIAPDRPLLDTAPLRAAVVNEKVADVLNYVVGPVLRGDINVFSDDHVANNLDLINVNVLEDVRSLFSEVSESPLLFSFIGLEATRRVVAPPLTRETAYTFSEYLKFVKKRVSDTFPINVEGRVVGLRSRNPQRNRNYVLVLGVLDGHPTFISVTLRNELYQAAIQAHRSNRTVYIRGRARRMKTQVKVTQLESFTVASGPPSNSA